MDRRGDLILTVGYLAPENAIRVIDEELAAGMRINMVTSVDEEETPFREGRVDVTLLAMCSDAGVAQHLLKKGANANQELDNGRTALDYALAQGHFGIMVQLLEGGLLETQDTLLLERMGELVEPSKRPTYKRIVQAYFGTPQQKADVVRWSLTGGTFRSSRKVT